MHLVGLKGKHYPSGTLHEDNLNSKIRAVWLQAPTSFPQDGNLKTKKTQTKQNNQQQERKRKLEQKKKKTKRYF